MKTPHKLLPLLLAGTMLAGCSEYTIPEGLHLLAYEAQTEQTLSHTPAAPIHLLFYGVPELIASLENTTVTLCPLSEEPLRLLGDAPGAAPAGTVTVTTIRHGSSLPTALPHIGHDMPFIEVRCLPAATCDQYDFYFRIADSEKKLLYHTADYRLILHTSQQDSTTCTLRLEPLQNSAGGGSAAFAPASVAYFSHLAWDYWALKINAGS